MAQNQKVSIGGLVFDAVLRTDHGSKITMTSHAVEFGANIADHSFTDPAQVSIEIGMTDCNGVGVSDRMFTALQDLQKTRQPMVVQTRFRRYDNMLIQSMSVPDDYTTANSLKAVLICKEILIVGTQTVVISNATAVSSRPQKQKAVSTNKGTIQPQKVKSVAIMNQATEIHQIA